jgi:glycosyltransferase involved in cell wall biosynthesis
MAQILLLSTLQTTLDIHFTDQIKIINNQNNKLIIASNFSMSGSSSDFECIHISFTRNLFRLNNVKAYFQLLKFLSGMKIDYIITQTPIASALVRLIYIINKNLSRPIIIYVVHGFHFQRGNTFVRNVFYFVEKYLARNTDFYITVNSSDKRVINHQFNVSKAFHLNGVGVKLDEVCTNNVIDFATIKLISVGEINKNKNHELVIRAISKLPKDISVKYDVFGSGPLENKLVRLVDRLDLVSIVTFHGYSSNIHSVLGDYHFFLLPSIREGLGIAALEAMAMGLPVISSLNAGSLDYIDHGKNGFFFYRNDADTLANLIYDLRTEILNYSFLSKNASGTARKYLSKNVLPEWEIVFRDIGIIK